jgi:hypothetical protein
MSAPNLQSPATITGKTAFLNLSSTSATTLLANSASSNNVIRVVHMTVSNSSSTQTATVSVALYSAASGGTAYPLVSNLTIPVGASVIVVGRENPLWIEEDRAIACTASAANVLTVVASYEQIS